MSYILDALKKVEEKRRQDQAPDLMTVHEDQGTVTKKRSPWTYILLAALILNAGLLAFWLIPSDNSHQEPRVGAGNIQGEIGERTLVVEKNGLPSGAQVTDVTETSPVKRTVDSSGKGVSALPDKTAPDEESEIPLSRRTTPLPDEKISLSKGDSGRIPDISELPSSLRDDLPEIKISGHVYFNTPADRLVIVNGRPSREGEILASGLQIEEITRSDVIFIYDNRRFSMKGF